MLTGVADMAAVIRQRYSPAIIMILRLHRATNGSDIAQAFSAVS